MRKLLATLAGTMAILTAASTAQAALVQIMGDDLIFEYDDSTLFGVASVVGNSIFFNPTTFKAESLDGTGTGFTTATINIETWVKNGSNYVMAGGSLLENGDYLLLGSNSSVSLSGQLRATSLTQGPPFQTADFIQTSGPLDTVGSLSAWDASAAVDFGTVAGWDTDSHVRFTVENLLIASTSVSGELAFIEKKFAGLGVTVLPEVPLPGAAWLFGSALLGLAGIQRRRKSS